MIKKIYQILITNNIEILKQEVSEIRGLFQALLRSMKRGRIRTKEDILEIKIHTLNIMKGIVTIVIVMLPGGFFFLPFTGLLFKRKSGAI